jgi:hypothetical protein
MLLQCCCPEIAKHHVHNSSSYWSDMLSPVAASEMPRAAAPIVSKDVIVLFGYQKRRLQELRDCCVVSTQVILVTTTA